ncbi:hypothetical protein ACF0H5_020749 [Mactra antiquata]
MSWSPWCDSIKALGFVAGGIYGHDGNQWAEFGMNDKYSLRSDDIRNIRECIANEDPNRAPVTVGGVRMMMINVNHNVEGQIIGKKGTSMCLVAFECNKSVIVGIGGENTDPRKFVDPFFKLATALKSSGN